MKNTKKVVVGSLATIAVSCALIGGATLAYFTDEASTNIAITAGNVEIAATVDENSFALSSMGEVMTGNTFANGGTVKYDATKGELTIDRITPGDEVAFNIVVDNKSDIDIKYQIQLASGSAKLLEGLDVTINNNKYNAGTTMFTSDWVVVKAYEAIEAIPMTIALPKEAGNEYKTEKCTLNVAVKAIQANGNIIIEREDYIPEEKLEADSSNEMGASLEFEWALRDQLKKQGISVDNDEALSFEDLHNFNGVLDLSGYQLGETLTNNNASVGYDYPKRELTEEEEAVFDGFTVPWAISDIAYGLWNVTKLDLSNTGLEYIPSLFMIGNPSMEEIILPDTVKAIGYSGTLENDTFGWGYNSFAWMKSLKKINIPKSLEYLADYSFAESPNLELNIEDITGLKASGRKIFRVVDCINGGWMPEGGSKVTGDAAVFAQNNWNAELGDFIFEGTAVYGDAAALSECPLTYRSTFGNIKGITGTLTVTADKTLNAWMFDGWSLDTLDIYYGVTVTGQAFANNAALTKVNVYYVDEVSSEAQTEFINSLFYDGTSATVNWIKV